MGSGFADDLEGTDQANTLVGGPGNDRLVGFAGDDILSGGAGADVLHGGEGVDRADYSRSTSGVLINLEDPDANGGDALGDVLHSIEIVSGSFHDDQFIGDAADNTFEGRLGADVINGGPGFDTASYEHSSVGVTVDLTAGTGATGDAEGDELRSIEQLVGSAFADTLLGSPSDETFQAGQGNDDIFGAAGSDRYRFGFGAGVDQIVEVGTMFDLDVILFDSEVEPHDVSVIREVDDLVLELERGSALQATPYAL